MADEITSVYVPFSAKGDDSQRIVEGYVSGNGNVDCDDQIVDPAWLKSELPTWLAAYGNVREQHNPARAVGKAQSVDLETPVGPYMAAKIVDDDAWRKVKEGVYNGFSVGIKNPRIVSDPVAKNGRIVGGRLIEVSVVDRPANDAAKFVLVKRAGDREWKDAQSGAVLEDLTKAADADTCRPCGCGPDGAMDGCTCDCAICQAAKAATPDAAKAPMSAAAQNDLPDAAFAYIEPGGEKDAEGKTTPRSKRHYPIHDDAHIRNALSRAAAQIKAGGEPAAIAEKALPAIRRAAKAHGIGDDSKEQKMADPEQPTAATPETEKAAASHVEHRHPFKGVHNHEHDDGRGGTHTHAHMHEDDDLHDHPHLGGKDARMLSPEDRDAAIALRRNADSLYFAANADATKAAGETLPSTEPTAKAAADFSANERADSLSRPSAIGQTAAILKDALDRIQALAGQTDQDKDGDVDTEANMGGAMDKRENAEFQGAQRADGINPGTLELTFTTEADLKKYIDSTVADLTKAATAGATTAQAELVKLAGGLAKGFEAMTSRLEASAKEAETTKAALADVQAELARVKELAQPPKGAVFAIDKGLGLEPDRVYRDGVVPEPVAAKAAAARLVAGMGEQERRDFHAELLKQMYTGGR